MESQQGENLVMSKLESKSTKEIITFLKDEYKDKVNIKQAAKEAGLAKFGFKCFLWFVR